MPARCFPPFKVSGLSDCAVKKCSGVFYLCFRGKSPFLFSRFYKHHVSICADASSARSVFDSLVNTWGKLGGNQDEFGSVKSVFSRTRCCSFHDDLSLWVQDFFMGSFIRKAEKIKENTIHIKKNKLTKTGNIQ